MKKFFTILVAAAAVSACFDNTGTELDSYVLSGFDPSSTLSEEVYISTLFKGGTDSVYVVETYYDTPFMYHAAVSGDGKLDGGFAICCGKDPVYEKDHEPSVMASLNGGSNGSLGYAIYFQGAVTPEKDVEFYIPNGSSYVIPNYFYVANTNAALCGAAYGTGLSGGAFSSEDFLKLTVTGYNGTAESGKVEVTLIDGNKPLLDWTQVDATALDKVTHLKFALECSRSDFPMYFCLDSFLIDYFQKY